MTVESWGEGRQSGACTASVNDDMGCLNGFPMLGWKRGEAAVSLHRPLLLGLPSRYFRMSNVLFSGQISSGNHV